MLEIQKYKRGPSMHWHWTCTFTNTEEIEWELMTVILSYDIFKNKEFPELLVMWIMFNPLPGTLPHTAGGHKKDSAYHIYLCKHSTTEQKPFPLRNKTARKLLDKTPINAQRHTHTFTAIRLLLDCLLLSIHDNLKSEARSARQENKEWM